MRVCESCRQPTSLQRKRFSAFHFLVLAVTFLASLRGLAQPFQQGFDFRNTATFVTDPPGTPMCYRARPIRRRSMAGHLWLGEDHAGARPGPQYRSGSAAGWDQLAQQRLSGDVLCRPAGAGNLQPVAGDGGCGLPSMLGAVPGAVPRRHHGAGHGDRGNHSRLLLRCDGKNWSAATWPGSNLSQQVTLAGTRLTVVVGTSNNNGDYTPIAFLGVAQVSARRISPSRPRRHR